MYYYIGYTHAKAYKKQTKNKYKTQFFEKKNIRRSTMRAHYCVITKILLLLHMREHDTIDLN